VNGADGISDIEGKVARASDEGDGKRPSFKSVAKTLHGKVATRESFRVRQVAAATAPRMQKIISSFVFIRG
jgi:hypothetical protein